jgi:magnesium chelatase family protein
MGMVVKTISFGINGIDGYLVEVEASSTRGMPKFDLVGLPDASVKESRDRVTSAMKNCGLQICSSHLTFNLAPADIRKEGPIYDLPITVCLMPVKPEPKSESDTARFVPDFSQVKGQQLAKRALEIAAAGSHNILMIGPPGSGKSMLAKRVPTILPDMSFEEMIETTKIHSIAGILHGEGLVTTRPFRSPHHNVSAVGLGGGGSNGIHPGEVSMAHHGVLFLDELPEFKRSALEVLRQPIEDGEITITRSGQTCTYPCSMMVIAAMNPCPCGYFGDDTHQCTCSPQKIHRYLNRVSGPLLDRFDIHVELPRVKFEELRSDISAESSEDIKKRVNDAREMQRERFRGSDTMSNATINAAQLQKFCVIDKEAENVLKIAFEKLGLTARAYDRVLKVSRTIADLDQSEVIKSNHVLEAVRYRSLDRKYWEN